MGASTKTRVGSKKENPQPWANERAKQIRNSIPIERGELKTNQLTTVAIALLAGNIFGLAITLLQLPNPPTLPVWIFILLALLGMIGAGIHKQKQMLWLTSVTTTVTWFLVQLLAGPVNRFVQRLADNPYVNYDITWVPITIMLAVAIPPFVILGLYWRALQNTSEMGQGIEQNDEAPPKRLFSILKMFNLLREKAEDKKYQYMDIVLGTDVDTKEKVVFKGKDQYLHTGIIGPTGTGKTSTTIKPAVLQYLEKIKAGEKLGVTILEPSGDLCDDVAEMCERMGIPYTHIDPIKLDSKFNPLQGDASIAAEATRTVLKNMFGKQEAFFSQVQQTAARNVILLLKEVHGDKLDLMDVVRCLRDTAVLNSKVTDLEKKKGNTDLVQYFRNELLGSMKDKYMQFAMGLRMQLEDILGNEHIKRTMTGKSSINLDKHLAEGGRVLLVNTALGSLGSLGNAFGQFFLMHFQGAVFRRPGTEWTRVPHVLFIDEFPLYLNPEFQRFLAIGRKYRCAGYLALQTLSQLSAEDSKVLTKIVRNKIVFGGLEEEDARKFEKEFGQKEVIMKQATYDNHILMPSIFAKGYRVTKVLEPRYPYTELMELEAYHFIYRIVKDGRLQPPGEAVSKFVDISKIGQPADEQVAPIDLKKVAESAAKKIKNLKHKISQEVPYELEELEEDEAKTKIKFTPLYNHREDKNIKESVIKTGEETEGTDEKNEENQEPLAFPELKAKHRIIFKNTYAKTKRQTVTSVLPTIKQEDREESETASSEALPESEPPDGKGQEPQQTPSTKETKKEPARPEKQKSKASNQDGFWGGL